jgi:hypothetical protein
MKKSKKKLKNKSEEIVRKFLIKKGFTVSDTLNVGENGIDLIAIKDGQSFLIEVKTAVFKSRSWLVKGLNKSGNLSDYIAIVFDNEVIFDTIEDHKRLCTKAGDRYLTKRLQFERVLRV